MQVAVIAVGGAAGAVLRYYLSNWVHGWAGRAFPYGTLSVNVIGSLTMGFLFVLLLERISMGLNWRAFLTIGLLGAFTTYSTFSIETLLLIEQGEPLKALLNVLSNVLLCLGGGWLGMVIGRIL